MRTARLTTAAAFLVVALQAAPAWSQTAFEDAPVSDNTLMVMVGKADINQDAQSTNTGVVANNSVGDNSVTGEIKIDQNAFQNLSGLSLLNVNTGNNVAMNSAMNVNISITPGL